MTHPLKKPTFKHLIDNDVIQVAEDRSPSIITNCHNAKKILQECAEESCENAYDHLSQIIAKIIDERPPNVMDYFEEFSKTMRQEKFQITEQWSFQKTYIEPERLCYAQNMLKFLKLPPKEDFPGKEVKWKGPHEDDDHKSFIKDVMHLQFYWSLAGLKFPETHIFLLSCSMRSVEEQSTVETCRFWGQLFGLEKNYFVLEVDLTEEEIDRRNENAAEIVPEETPRPIHELTEDLIPSKPEYTNPWDEQKNTPLPPPLPNCPIKRSREIPTEILGTGINRKTYFVCNNYGDEWIELPLLTIKQLNTSKLIKKYLTGNLEQEIVSWPTFPGVEKNYLRAIISRITSGTYVAPVGYYRVKSDEDDEVEEEQDEDNDDEDETEEDYDNDKITEPAPNYEPVDLKELENANAWIHYRPNILNQGRVNWFNPKNLESKDDGAEAEDEDEMDEEQEEEEDDERSDEIQREIEPKLFSSCDNDVHPNIMPWTILPSRNYNMKNVLVIAKSNIWPGAFSMISHKVHDSVYIGWGVKFVQRNFRPPSIPQIPPIYLIGPEVLEVADPTVEQEEAWRLAQEARKAGEFYDEIGEEDEGEEEDDSKDEDDTQ